MAKNQNRYFGKITKVIDGDTFEAIIDLGFGVKQEFHVRLDGIDTPEVSTEKGKKAREYVKELVENKSVVLTDEGAEKYGRARAKIELMDGTDLAQLLIEKKIGIEYHGGKKTQGFAQLTPLGVISFK